MARSYSHWTDRRYDGNSLSKLDPITTVANGTRYYSSTDAQIFIGNVFIDEVKQIQWQMSQNVMPIFGYNSYTADGYAVGSRVIQGQFTINFTKAEYLNELLRDKDFVRISRHIYADDPQVVSYFSNQKMARLNRPMFDSGFDIVIGFGDQSYSTSGISSDIYKTFGILECCQIQGHQMDLDETGKVISETYTFIAKDYSFNKSDEVPTIPNAAAAMDTLATYANKVNPNVLDLTGTFKNSIQSEIVLTNKLNGELVSGSIMLLDQFTHSTLRTSINLKSSGTSELYASIDKSKSKLLSNDIKKFGYRKLRAQISIEYKDINMPGDENKKRDLNIILDII